MIWKRIHSHSMNLRLIEISKVMRGSLEIIFPVQNTSRILNIIQIQAPNLKIYMVTIVL